jgi:tetratricopeptide (TPR) repeat protein
MIIIHQVGSFLEELFPELKGRLNDERLIKNTIADYYTYENIRPEVKVKNGLIEIHIKTDEILNQQVNFNKAIKLCENNRFKEAIPILTDLIKMNPTNSEYYRTLGQAYSMTGDDESGINYLIDALKWNPKNNYALIMVGNIFARNKNDIETAKKYYLQVIENNPNDAIAINNLGTNLLQVGKIDEGLQFLMKANEINPDYPNSLYGIGLVNQMKGDNQKAFSYALKSLKKCGKGEQELIKNAKQLLFESSREIAKTDIGKRVFDGYHQLLQEKSKKEIRIEIDNTLDTAAKIEFGENYNRSFHLIKYNPKYPTAYPLMMHELVHLEFAIDASEASCNKLFITNQANKKLFIDSLRQHRSILKKKGLSEDSIDKYHNSLFEGINRQIFNVPIDLFIEDKLFDEYEELRPFQFLSLYTITLEGIQATTEKNVISLSPPSILFSSKVLNLVLAMQFRDLFGLDTISEFKSSFSENSTAKKFYEEFYEYRDDKEPGEEYELIENWAKDLKLDKYFSLIEEKEYRKDKTLDGILEKIEKDPFDLESHDPIKEQEMQEFQETQKKMGTNMAVVMFMVDALQYFEGMPKEKIKEIAYDIALQGTQGYRPENKSYRIGLIPDKVFSGYHILAYYYISWMLAIPEMVSKLQLPFDEEYKLALTMYKPGNK